MSLDKDDQAAWDKLSDHGKWQILYGNPDPNKNPPPFTLKTNSRKMTHVNEMQIVDSDSSDEFQDAVKSNEPSTLLINTAKTEPNLSPGDIQNILSSSQADQPNLRNPNLRPMSTNR